MPRCRLHGPFALLAAIGVIASCNRAPSVQGTVVDNFGTPIAGASIVLDGTELRSQTAADGTFELEGSPGAFTIRASASGHLEEGRQVTLSEGADLPLSLFELLQLPSAGDVVLPGLGEYVSLEEVELPRAEKIVKQVRIGDKLMKATCDQVRPPTQPGLFSGAEFLLFVSSDLARKPGFVFVKEQDGLLVSARNGSAARSCKQEPEVVEMEPRDVGNFLLYRGSLESGRYCLSRLLEPPRDRKIVGEDATLDSKGACFEWRTESN